MVYGTTLRLTGEFTENNTVDAHTDDYSDKLRVAMSHLRLCPPCVTQHKKTIQGTGPYKVVSRGGPVCKILQKGKVETITADCVKPAHIEREAEPGIT